MRRPHKHAELIKAWADGATIQYREANGSWEDWDATNSPCWFEQDEYRIKPEPKPDVVFYYHGEFIKREIKPYGRSVQAQFYKDALKLVWDGETGKLKSAEVLV